jgi:hypothetical protein
MYRIACVLSFAVILTANTAALASDPIGGYLIVDKVVLHPSEGPTTIQIWGSIALATKRGGSTYADPVRGYLYYKAGPGKEAVCRKEWKDLKKMAGTAQVIGFGSSYDLKALGTVRKANEKPETPDVYPLADGLVKMDKYEDYSPVRNLLALPAPKEPTEGDLVPPGAITLTVRNIPDKKHARASYFFELEGASGGKAETTVEPGQKETRWSPSLKLKPGEKYTWRVRAVQGDWKGPVATTRFVVKGQK